VNIILELIQKKVVMTKFKVLIRNFSVRIKNKSDNISSLRPRIKLLYKVA